MKRAIGFLAACAFGAFAGGLMLAVVIINTVGLLPNGKPIHITTGSAR